MTVQEVIDALKQMPPELQVEVVDPVDGYEPVEHIVRRPESNTVVIL